MVNVIQFIILVRIQEQIVVFGQGAHKSSSHAAEYGWCIVILVEKNIDYGDHSIQDEGRCKNQTETVILPVLIFTSFLEIRA